MAAKGKGRAGSKPSGAAASQAESRASTVAEATQAPIESIEETREPSDEEQVSSEQLQALRKRVAEQEEYTTLL
jgi:hypothetical protein